MSERTQTYDEISNTMIHRMYTDIQDELNQESNEKELILGDDNPETIYFNEDLTLEELGEDIVLSTSNIEGINAPSNLGHDVLEDPSVTTTKVNNNSHSTDVEGHSPHLKPPVVSHSKVHSNDGETVVHSAESKPHYVSDSTHADHDKTTKPHVVPHTVVHNNHSESATSNEEIKTHSEHSKSHPASHLEPAENAKSHITHSKTHSDESSSSHSASHSKPHQVLHSAPTEHDKATKSHVVSHSKVHSNDDESAVHSAEPKAHSTTHSKSHLETLKHIKEKAIVDNDNQDLRADQVKLNHQAIKRAKEIMESRKNIAHSFIDVEVDVSELVSLLSIMREAYAPNELELTLLPFYIKAVYDGLKKFPILNSSFISKEHALLLKWFYNIAFSVDIDAGVKMPVLYDLKNESIKEIALKSTRLIEQTVNDKLTEKDYQDASFSIVNYGEYGITRGTFTIPEDNVAGIAMGIIFKKPVVVEKNDITIRDIMVITLGYNEAVVDVTEASKFAHYVAYLLSNPGLLL
ncbi:hypothetical protein E7Y35_02815 [Spiroplasma sp. SV19]|nr:hypothetical protein E7Y35_02815 [Spiroplasma sp. SV19]